MTVKYCSLPMKLSVRCLWNFQFAAMELLVRCDGIRTFCIDTLAVFYTDYSCFSGQRLPAHKTNTTDRHA